LKKSQLERLRAFLDGDEYKTKSEPRDLNEDNIDEVLFSENKWNGILMTDTGPFHLQAYLAGINRVKEELGGFSTFVQSDDLAAVQARNITVNIVGVNKRLRDNIRSSISGVLAKGGSRPEIVQSIEMQFDTSLARVNTIARTETGIAASRARWDAMSVEVETKQWISAEDGSVRPTHREYAKKGSVAMNYEYASNLHYPLEEGAEAHEVVNCRCVLVKGLKK
jgi:hypothetical protein